MLEVDDASLLQLVLILKLLTVVWRFLGRQKTKINVFKNTSEIYGPPKHSASPPYAVKYIWHLPRCSIILRLPPKKTLNNFKTHSLRVNEVFSGYHSVHFLHSVTAWSFTKIKQVDWTNTQVVIWSDSHKEWQKSTTLYKESLSESDVLNCCLKITMAD